MLSFWVLQQNELKKKKLMFAEDFRKIKKNEVDIVN